MNEERVPRSDERLADEIRRSRRFVALADVDDPDGSIRDTFEAAGFPVVTSSLAPPGRALLVDPDGLL